MAAQVSRPSFRAPVRLSLRPSHVAPVRHVAEDDAEEMVSLNGTIAPASGSVTPPSNRQTRTGLPDRRFKGQRDLEIDPIQNPEYKHATPAQDYGDGIPRTKNGAPDRRYMANRALSADEALFNQAEFILQQKKH